MDAFYDLPVDLKARWLRRRVAGSTLLEVGCGTGAFLQAARQCGFQVEGLEPSAERARVASARTGAIIHQVLLEDFQPGSARYDVVYHTDLLAHFADPRAALRRMTSLLTPGGVLAFEVGLVGGLPRFWYKGIVEISYPEHRWLFSRKSLMTLLSGAGLRPTHTTRYDLSLCGSLTLLLRLLAKLRPGVRDHGLQAPVGLPTGAARPRVSLEERSWYNSLQTFLRYRAGWVMPPMGPGTQFVVARPL